MTYYKELQRAFKYLDEKIVNNPKIDENKLVYVTTLNFAVSESKVRKRIKLIKEVM